MKDADDLVQSLTLCADAYESEARDATAHLIREARDRIVSLQRQLKKEPARIRKLVLDIVHSEHEAPGPMPATIAEALERSPEDCMRAAIRATKHSIAGRIAHADMRLSTAPADKGSEGLNG